MLDDVYSKKTTQERDKLKKAIIRLSVRVNDVSQCELYVALEYLLKQIKKEVFFI